VKREKREGERTRLQSLGKIPDESRKFLIWYRIHLVNPLARKVREERAPLSSPFSPKLRRFTLSLFSPISYQSKLYPSRPLRYPADIRLPRSSLSPLSSSLPHSDLQASTRNVLLQTSRSQTPIRTRTSRMLR